VSFLCAFLKVKLLEKKRAEDAQPNGRKTFEGIYFYKSKTFIKAHKKAKKKAQKR
jgi:hypothetical protein